MQSLERAEFDLGNGGNRRSQGLSMANFGEFISNTAGSLLEQEELLLKGSQ